MGVALPPPPDTPNPSLLIDIETLPQLGYFWDDHRPFNIIRRIEPTTICCVTAKWLGGRMVTIALPDYPGYRPHNRDDKRLVADLWTLLDQAETVIGHNGARFDVRKINARMTLHHMPPYSPVKVFDTLKAARATGAYDSNRLNELSRTHGNGEKVETGGQALWFSCMAGDAKAWKRMRRYNEQDVRLLEAFYFDIRPWAKSHPNASVYCDGAVCPHCASSKIQKRGYSYTRTGTYERFQCQRSGCGGWSRGVSRVPEGRASLVSA
jgi:hypothetical protein